MTPGCPARASWRVPQVTSLWPVELMAALGALARQHQASEMALLMLGLKG